MDYHFIQQPKLAIDLLQQRGDRRDTVKVDTASPHGLVGVRAARVLPNGRCMDQDIVTLVGRD